MSRHLHGLEVLSPEDRLLAESFSQGPRTQPRFSVIHKAFENVVERQSEIVALEHNGHILTYGDLERSANSLANSLIRDGLEPGQKVCLVVQRSMSMVIAILAVLKCGCQYVPLDGGVLPEHLLRHIIENTNARFVLCLQSFLHKVQRANKRSDVVVLDTLEANWKSALSIRPDVEVASSYGAYVIYTSGTTGTPKGVDVTHGNVTNLLCLEPGSLGITKGTNVAQLLSVSFDMGQWEILATLMNGGTLLLRTSDWQPMLKKAHTIIATPSILATLQREKYPNIRTIALAGEACPRQLADEWSTNAAVYIGCGPTEVTIVNTLKRHNPNQSLSIGKPVPNTNVYILDANEDPVAIGSVGVMWAGGSCVSRGYVGLPELTARKFKHDKFVNDGSSMFNTGDLGRWLENGSLEHHGRIDDQAKIKGFRVELDGVSAAIEKTLGVARGCAILSDKVLWGFYSGPTYIDELAVKEVVKKYQPYYAIPERWVFLKSLPLTPNGKTDRKALLASITTNSPDKQEPSVLVIPQECQILTSITADSFSPSSSPSDSSFSLEKYTLPEKKGIHGLRALRHRVFSLYRRLFSVVFIANMVALIVILSSPRGIVLGHLATAIASNLTASVLIRQDHVVNLLFTVACSVPTSFPIFIRRNCAKVYHIGGLHSGFAVASVIWLLAFTVVATIRRTSPAVLVITYLLVSLLLLILALAHPTLRSKYHNYFELVHRFAGWTSLALFWVQTIIFANSTRSSTSHPTSLGRILLQTPGIWLLSVATFSIALPWIMLRKVSVRADVLSPHAVRLYFKYTTPVVGTAVRISERPLLEWHAFATIAKPQTGEESEKGFSLLVSNAGDWTSRQIKRAPSKIWVRGVPACGVLRIVPLFKNVVLVATGSGIGPCLPVIYAKMVPARIFWSTPNPEKTFGKEIIDVVKACDENAVIWDTKAKGRPDMVREIWQLVQETGAEAVCVIANQKVTRLVVYGMESRGMPAFGAIWDS